MTAGPRFSISQSIMGQVKTIAANDGGDKKSKIDTRKGYDELCNLISGNTKMTRTDKQYLLALKAEYLDLREQGESEVGKVKVKVNGVELLVSKAIIDIAKQIAKTDNGKYKDEVDNGAGYKALKELLKNNTIAMTSADRAYIKILLVYYEEKYLGARDQSPVEPEPEPEPEPPVQDPEPPVEDKPEPPKETKPAPPKENEPGKNNKPPKKPGGKKPTTPTTPKKPLPPEGEENKTPNPIDKLPVYSEEPGTGDAHWLDGEFRRVPPTTPPVNPPIVTGPIPRRPIIGSLPKPGGPIKFVPMPCPAKPQPLLFDIQA